LTVTLLYQTKIYNENNERYFVAVNGKKNADTYVKKIQKAFGKICAAKSNVTNFRSFLTANKNFLTEV